MTEKGFTEKGFKGSRGQGVKDLEVFTRTLEPSNPRTLSSYIELRCHSAFSFLSGASLPEDLIERAAALGYPVLALGDRDGVYGAPRFHQAAKRAGLRALVGAAVTLDLRVQGFEGPRVQENAPMLYLLVANRSGYQNLCRLITRTKVRAPKGESVTTWEDFEGQTDELICLAGGADGPLAAALRNPRTLESLNPLLLRLQRLFPNRLYIDLQRHLDPEEERLNRALIGVAARFNIPLVATNDVRHASPSGKPLFDVLTCIRNKTTLDAAGRALLKNAERHLKSPMEMAALFRDLPEAIANTQRIAEQCAFTLADLGYRFPDYPLPPGETPIGYLRALTHAGARTRYGTITPRIRQQLEHELAVIGKLDLAGYFLIVWDIVRFCREHHILAQGRGSAANSAVCYALGITAVDAVGMDLLFERFLSEERGEWPDIDIDLPSGAQREKVIQYVYRRYGPHGAAMTANVITYRTRSAAREVGKALGFSLEQVDRLSKLLQRFEFRDSADDFARQLQAGGIDPAVPRVQLLVDLVQQIQGLPRHLGQHSGGMVVAAGRLDTVVPLEPAAMPGRVVVQWDKDDCADLGIIKVDLLGLGMMAVLEESIPLVREHEGGEIDLAHLPQDDPKVYAMLRQADTIGVFQVESRAQMATLPRMKPDHFYDLVVEVAIIRPGPIVGQMVHPYLNRRNGREPVTYAHPDLEPILRRTLGVPLFQEQLLRMAMTLAGFTGGEAEELRRAMGFKRSAERMKVIEARLRSGMEARGITGKTADEIIRGITSFALYGFPESHAASFALLAYASAYLRAHHLAAFTCAMLNNWPLGFYHPATLVKDAQRHGLRVLPIDVTHSSWKCTLERLDERVLTLSPFFLPRPLGSAQNTVAAGLRARRTDLRAGTEACAHQAWLLRAFHGARVNRRFMTTVDTCEDVLREPQHERSQSPSNKECSAHPEPFDVAQGMLVEGYFQRKSTDPLGEGTTVTAQHAAPACHALRLGLRYVAGLREEAAHRIEAERGRTPFTSVADVAIRCGLRDNELANLAHIGAFAAFDLTRREALWQAAAIPKEPLFSKARDRRSGAGAYSSPLPAMSALDRTLADYKGTGITVGPHLMQHLRQELTREGVLRAADLRHARNGQWAKIAGLVIVRQRPGTAKGFCFLTLEDETGTSNAVVVPDMFQRWRAVIHTAALLVIEGPLQKVDGVIHVRARVLRALSLPQQTIGLTGSGYRMRVTPEDEPPPTPPSHDFR